MMVRRRQADLPPTHHINSGDYFFFFFAAAFFVAKSLTPLRSYELEPTLHSLYQHVVDSLERVGTNLFEPLVTLERRRNGCQRRLPFDQQPAFD